MRRHVGVGRSRYNGGSGGGGGFATPNIWTNIDFESGFGPLTDWSGDPPPTGITHDTTQGHSGTASIQRAWVPNPSSDIGSQTLLAIGKVGGGFGSGFDRVWTRFYMKQSVHITSVMKFWRFYDAAFSTPLGGFFTNMDTGGSAGGNGFINWGTDEENGSIITTIGVTEAQVIDGGWHCFEIDYWRNGDPSGFPSAAFWFDGNPQFEPDGTSTIKFHGAGNNSFWASGRLNSGERLSDGNLKIGVLELVGTLNTGNTTTGTVNIDDIAVSTLGRIGP